jgi:AcrR family transcriptional regulator
MLNKLKFRTNVRLEKMSFNERFNKICKTSSQLIHKKGFSNTTMRDIARATGMSLGGLYHYFDNKEDLLFKILKNYMDITLSNLEKGLASLSSPKEQITFILQRHIDLYVHHIYESKCILHEREYLKGKRLAVIKKEERRYFEICRDVINRLCKDADCRFINSNILTFSFLALCNWIYQWYDPKGPIHPRDFARQLTQFFLRGVYGKKV